MFTLEPLGFLTKKKKSTLKYFFVKISLKTPLHLVTRSIPRCRQSLGNMHKVFIYCSA